MQVTPYKFNYTELIFSVGLQIIDEHFLGGRVVNRSLEVEKSGEYLLKALKN